MGAGALPPPRWQAGLEPVPVGNHSPPVRGPVLAPARTQGCCGVGGRSRAGAVQGFPCTRGVSLHPQRSLLGARRPGLSAQHPAPARNWRPAHPRGHTAPKPPLQPTQQQTSAARGSPPPCSPVPGCAPQPRTQTPALHSL